MCEKVYILRRETAFCKQISCIKIYKASRAFTFALMTVSNIVRKREKENMTALKIENSKYVLILSIITILFVLVIIVLYKQNLKLEFINKITYRNHCKKE